MNFNSDPALTFKVLFPNVKTSYCAEKYPQTFCQHVESLSLPQSQIRNKNFKKITQRRACGQKAFCLAFDGFNQFFYLFIASFH